MSEWQHKVCRAIRELRAARFECAGSEAAQLIEDSILDLELAATCSGEPGDDHKARPESDSRSWASRT